MHTVVREDVVCPVGINEVHQQRGLGVILASAEVGVVLCGRSRCEVWSFPLLKQTHHGCLSGPWPNQTKNQKQRNT